MSGFFSTHSFDNGVMTTVENMGDDMLSIRVQGEDEEMLVDIICGEHEALCLAHSILSVVTNPGEDQ